MYIEEWGIYNNFQTNFCEDKVFHYSKDDYVLTLDNCRSTFKVASTIHNNDVVEDISIIVGDNGSGKTSIYSFLKQFIFNPISTDDIPKFIVAFEVNENLVVKSSIAEVVFDQRIELIKSDSLYTPFNKLIYYSPLYNPYHNTSSHGDIIDLSATNKLVNPKNKNEMTTDILSLNLSNEMLDTIDFYYNASEVEDLIPELHIPKSLLIKVTQIPKVEVDENNKLKKQIVIKVNKLIDRLGKLKTYGFDNDKNGYYEFAHDTDKRKYSFITNFLLTYLIKIIITDISNDKSVLFDKSYFSILDSFNFEQDLSNELLLKYIKELTQVETELVSQFIDNITLSGDITFGKDFTLIIETKSKITLKKIIKNYFNFMSKNNSILEFYWYPSISAGEFSTLNLFSSFYQLLRKENEDPIRDLTQNMIVFFDEVEITMHPKLQINLIYNLITFFKRYFENNKIHLIFATHSPFLLSDSFKENCVFLSKSENTKKGQVKSIKLNNTFGANINSLYLLPMFLNETGLIGKWAKETIDFILNKITQIDKNDMEISFSDYEDLELISNKIGEPVIKEYIDNLMDSIKPNVHNNDDILKNIIIEQEEEIKRLQAELLRRDRGKN